MNEAIGPLREALEEMRFNVAAHCEALEDEAHADLEKDQTEHASGYYRGQKFAAKSIRRAFGDYYRTALAKLTQPVDPDIEAVAKWLHDEGDFDEAWSHRTWPEHPDDTGQREGGFVKIVPSDVQAKFRDVARRLLARFPNAAASLRNQELGS